MKSLRLMIPGPIELDSEVLSVMAEPLVAHYGNEWTRFYKETMELLQQVFRTQGHVFLIPGSGSAGLDAAFGSILSASDKVLIPQNGFFGERLAEIASSHTPHVSAMHFDVGQPIELDRIETAIKKERFSLLAVTHCETSTGMLNPIKELGKICRDHGVLFIVDAIASLGIESLAMDEWGIDVCVSASQKGLESPPGLALVAVGDQGWQRIERIDNPGWYLNLKVWKEYEEKWGGWHPHPITHAVNNVRALRVAIERILVEGVQVRVRRHHETTAFLRQELTKRGFSTFIPERFAAHGVTAVMSEHNDVNEILSYLKDQHGLLLAGSLGELKGKVFRVGHMGPGATKEAMGDLLFALDEYMKMEGASANN